MKNTRALIENGLHELQKEPPGKTRDYAMKVISIWAGADDPQRETRVKAMGDIHRKAHSVLLHNSNSISP